MIEKTKVEEESFVDTGLNIYTFKQASNFQSSIIAFLIGMKSNKEEVSEMSKIFK